MKGLKFIIFQILCLLAVSCGIDTYNLPDASIQGTLIDEDGNSLISEQPNGYKIRLQETGATSYIDFWGKADGTYKNTKVFSGKYTVQPIEGAFFPVDPVEINIDKEVILNFDVIPFLHISAEIVSVDKSIKAVYKIRKADGAGKIKTARLLVTKWNPNVGMNCINWEKTRNFATTEDSAIVSVSHTDVITDILESGVTYYARIAVLSENSAGRYNFSPVIKLVIP